MRTRARRAPVCRTVDDVPALLAQGKDSQLEAALAHLRDKLGQ